MSVLRYAIVFEEALKNENFVFVSIMVLFLNDNWISNMLISWFLDIVYCFC